MSHVNPRTGRRLLLESLEDRQLMAGITLSTGGFLQIQGTGGKDTAQVSVSGSSVKAVLNNQSKTYSASSVKAITFYGGDGDDTFRNLTSIFADIHGEGGRDSLYGGPGSDFLEGGPGDDQLDGGKGNDVYKFVGSSLGADTITDAAGVDTIDLSDRGGGNTLDLSRTGLQVVRSGNLSLNLKSGSAIENVGGSKYDDIIFGNSLANTLLGNGGNDRLYGRGGADTLEGGSADDALFGGAGSDMLRGGSGEDRLLVQSGDSTPDFNNTYDAKINFVNGNSTWTDKEIEVVDEAFAKMYNHVGNQLLATDPVTGAMTFKKVNVTEFSGRNSLKNGVRTIEIDEWNESNTAENTSRISTVIHEMGHNWDNELTDLGVFNQFMKISGWTQKKPTSGSYTKSKDGEWWYKSSASFARDYGRTNPREDWSTTWQAYFDAGYSSSSPIAAKLKIVDGVLDWIQQGAPLF